jgi:activator of 2-hydroxyglutaryl-CoA dehydratase
MLPFVQSAAWNDLMKSLRRRAQLFKRHDRPNKERQHMKVLAIDVGGTHVKILASEERTPQQFVSGPKMAAEEMVPQGTFL